jgi:signal transduction histidine kinase
VLTFEKIEGVFDRGRFTVPLDARKRARVRSLAAMPKRTRLRSLGALATTDDNPAATAAASASFAVELLAELAVDLAARPADAALLIAELERVCATPRFVFARGVLRAPGLQQLPAAVALEVQLALLLVFTEATAVSLWRLRALDEELEHTAHAGEFNLRALYTRRVARRLLAGKSPGSHVEGSAVGVAVGGVGKERAALVARGSRRKTETLALLEIARPVLGATLARAVSPDDHGRLSPAGRARAETILAQLKFELHDGPQQGIIMLAEDLRLFRAQLEPVIGESALKQLLVGRIDDLVARVAGLEQDLREILRSLATPFTPSEPVIDLLMSLTDEFAARTGIEPETTLDGDLMNLSELQLTTLVAVVREALTNVRKHSGAEHVTLAVRGAPAEVTVTVTDDGCGFASGSALLRAVRDGHIGLAGMHERVRLLGGRVQIDSRPGGPTVVSAVLPAKRKSRPSRQKARQRRLDEAPILESAGN